VLDCSDNFGTRFALNNACVAAGRPLVSGAAVRLSGQVASFDLRNGGPCYACLFDEHDETLEDCAGNGVLAPLVGVVGALQAVEAIRYFVGIGTPATGRLLRIDAANFAVTEARFGRDSGCTVCTCATTAPSCSITSSTPSRRWCPCSPL
jgi:adenylyltransferase/sulfurtransferase